MHYRSTLVAAAATAAFILASQTPASAGNQTLFAILNGGNECIGSGPPSCLQGDTDGYGVASITLPNSTTLCFSILVNKIDTPFAAHIHSGTATVNGPIVLALSAPASGNPGSVAGCIASPAGFNNSLAGNPPAFYVNVHTEKFQNGAIRGQVF
jgi:hypothetical protein